MPKRKLKRWLKGKRDPLFLLLLFRVVWSIKLYASLLVVLSPAVTNPMSLKVFVQKLSVSLVYSVIDWKLISDIVSYLLCIYKYIFNLIFIGSEINGCSYYP